MARGKTLTVKVLEDVGISYRQLDYWSSQGYLHPTEKNPGSGVPREWSPAELQVAAMISRLRDAGLDMVTAARAGRQVAAQESFYKQVEIADGVWIMVTPL